MSISLCWMTSCSKWTNSENNQSNADAKSLNLLKASLPPHFSSVNPAELSPGPQTKLQIHEPVVLDINNLDWENAKSHITEEYQYLQLPVNSLDLINMTQLKFTKIEADSIVSRAGAAKTFLILRHNHEYEDLFIFLATMIPQPKYYNEEKIAKMDYFNTQDMNGLIMHSDLSGKLCNTTLLINGIYSGSYRGLEEGESLEDVAICLYMPESNADTKCNGGFSGYSCLVPDYCDNDKVDKPKWWDEQDIGGGGGGSDTTYEVILKRIGPGTTTGENYYRERTTVTCTAIPDRPSSGSTPSFNGWDKDLALKPMSYTFKITKRITATAHFRH